jgi:hypothetical protein
MVGLLGESVFIKFFEQTDISESATVALLQ